MDLVRNQSQTIAPYTDNVVDTTTGYSYLYPQDRTLRRLLGNCWNEYYEVLIDDQIRASYLLRAMQLVQKPWTVSPGDDQASSEEAAIAFKEEVFDTLPWPTIAEQMLFANHWGFQPIEVLAERDGSITRITNLLVHDPRRFRYSPTGELLILRRSNYLGDRLPARRVFTVDCPGIHNDDPYSQGLAPILYWLWKGRGNSVGWWLTRAETLSKGVKAKVAYPDGTSREEVTEIAATAAAFLSDDVLAHPESWSGEILEVGDRGMDAYEPLNKYIDACISKLITGGSLSLDQGTREFQANLSNEAVQGFAQRDGLMISTAINNHLSRWWLDWNTDRFPGAAAPQYSYILDTPESLDSRAARDRLLYDIGIRLNPDRIPEIYGEEYESFDTIVTDPGTARDLAVAMQGIWK